MQPTNSPFFVQRELARRVIQLDESPALDFESSAEGLAAEYPEDSAESLEDWLADHYADFWEAS